MSAEPPMLLCEKNAEGEGSENMNQKEASPEERELFHHTIQQSFRKRFSCLSENGDLLQNMRNFRTIFAREGGQSPTLE